MRILAFALRAWLLWLAGLLFCALGWAQPAAVSLSGLADPALLDTHSLVLEDRDKRLTPDEVLTQAHLPWRAAGGVVNFNFSASVYWLRLRLHNDGPTSVTRLLETGSALQDIVDYHLVRQGRIVQTVQTGDRRPFDQRPLPYRYPVFPITLAAGETVEVLLRLDTHDGLFEALPLRLRTPAGFLHHSQIESVAFGAYYGAVVALLLYNLLLSVLTRDRLFVFYVLYLTSYVLWNLCFTGLGLQYLWPAMPDLGHLLISTTVPLIALTLTLFSMHYLQTAARVPRVHRVLRWMALLAVLHLPLAWLDWYAALFLTVLPLLAVLLPLLMGAAFAIARQGYRPALFYLVAWAPLAVGAGLTLAKIVGWIEASPLVEYSLNIGSALEFTLLALAMADALNRLKAEKLQAEQQALQVQRALAADLEAKVRERTQALELANAQLQQVAITDALTGVYNRRSFDATLRREYNRCLRQGLPLALCVMDIDHFKPYNDALGHQQGDRALVAVAQALAARVQRSTEYLFRLGGEEFAVLMVDEDRDRALRQVEALRACVPALELPHPASPAGRVTISCGLVWVERPTAEQDPAALYALADQALYRAKQAGRNRTEVAA
ncbi:MAG: diguanylate cyclase [Burkholderiaceae bacterium]